MKKINPGIVLLLVIIGTMLSTIKVFAQVSTVQYVTIENNIAQIENLSIFDSVTANNKIVHTASFDIAVTNAEATIALLTALQASLKDSKQPNLLFSKVQFINSTTDGQLKEERKYSTCMVKEMLLPALNAAEKAQLKMRIKLQAEAVAINYMNTAFSTKRIKKGTVVMTAFYKLSIEDLPTTRVTKISALQLSKNNTAQNISIEIATIDERKWNERYANGSGKIIEKGIIELLAPNFKDVILTIYIEQLRIVSYSTSSSNANTIAKSVYGLSVAAVSMQSNK